MDVLKKPEYAGVMHAIRPVAADDWDSPSEDEPGQDEIEDDMEGEQETITFDNLSALAPPDDDDGDVDDEDTESAMGDLDDLDGDTKMKDLCSVIQEASTGVVESTDAEYKRYIQVLPSSITHR